MIKLVVEAKLRAETIHDIETQLKRYMLAMSCPVGLLVTPNEVSIYKDTYVNRTESSIERLGPYRVPPDWIVARAAKTASPLEFEKAVGEWLERVTRSEALRGFPAPAIDAFESLVVPALADGLIQGSGPAIYVS
jgi:hypothetical protein